MSKLIGPGYFYKIVFNRGEDPWLYANSTVMFFPTGDIPPTNGRIEDEARRKLSEIYDTKNSHSSFLHA